MFVATSLTVSDCQSLKDSIKVHVVQRYVELRCCFFQMQGKQIGMASKVSPHVVIAGPCDNKFENGF